jgi:hypothetical protein
MHNEMLEELECNCNKFMMQTLKEWGKAKEAEANTMSDDDDEQQKKKKAKED